MTEHTLPDADWLKVIEPELEIASNNGAHKTLTLYDVRQVLKAVRYVRAPIRATQGGKKPPECQVHKTVMCEVMRPIAGKRGMVEPSGEYICYHCDKPRSSEALKATPQAAQSDALSKDDGLLEALKKIKDFPRDDTSPELFYWNAVKTAETAIAAAASKGGA